MRRPLIDHGVLMADDTPAAIKARVAGKRVSFDTATPLSTAAFHGLPVQGLELTNHHVQLLSSAPEVVLAALIGQGVMPQNLEVVGAGLEEAFLSLTSGKGE